MKIAKVLALLLIGALAVAPLAQAQQAAPGAAITQTGSRGDALSRCDSVTGTSQQTLTLTNGGAGLSAYIGYIGVYGLGNGAVTTALPTQTVISGTAMATASTAGIMPLASGTTAAFTTGAVSGGPLFFNPPLKTAVNVAAVITGPTAITNMNQLIQACYYFAP